EVLAHLGTAGIPREAVTVLTAPVTPPGAEVPARLQTEVHDPTDRNKLAYLASTAAGRRLYLNRTLVHADFVIVISGRRHDPGRGDAGAEAALYPSLADAEVRDSFEGQFTSDAPGEEPWPVRAEAAEVTRLLGTPFFVQVIAGAGDSVQEVVAG